MPRLDKLSWVFSSGDRWAGQWAQSILEIDQDALHVQARIVGVIIRHTQLLVFKLERR
jgi:hypothetical protein